MHTSVRICGMQDEHSTMTIYSRSSSSSNWTINGMVIQHISPSLQCENLIGWLARCMQDLNDPYCQSMCLYACLCVRVSATPMLNVSETKPFRGSWPIGKCLRRVDWWRHLWRHVTVLRHYSWRHILQNRRIRKLGPGSTIRVDPLSAHCRRT